MHLALLFIALLFAYVCMSQQLDSTQSGPHTVRFTSGSLLLKGLLWKLAGTNPFPAALFNHGSEDKTLKHLNRIAPALLR